MERSGMVRSAVFAAVFLFIVLLRVAVADPPKSTPDTGTVNIKTSTVIYAIPTAAPVAASTPNTVNIKTSTITYSVPTPAPAPAGIPNTVINTPATLPSNVKR